MNGSSSPLLSLCIEKGECMSDLSAMVKEYKDNPSEELKNEIIDFLVNAENPEELSKIRRASTERWIEVDGVRIKPLEENLYVVTESFALGSSYMCYAYKVDLSAYSRKQILAFQKNCPQYRDRVESEDVFSVLAIALAFDDDGADLCEIVQNDAERKLWYEKVDREVK